MTSQKKLMITEEIIGMKKIYTNLMSPDNSPLMEVAARPYRISTLHRSFYPSH